jgi:hypothetical protein
MAYNDNPFSGASDKFRSEQETAAAVKDNPIAKAAGAIMFGGTDQQQYIQNNTPVSSAPAAPVQEAAPAESEVAPRPEVAAPGYGGDATLTGSDLDANATNKARQIADWEESNYGHSADWSLSDTSNRHAPQVALGERYRSIKRMWSKDAADFFSGLYREYIDQGMQPQKALNKASSATYRRVAQRGANPTAGEQALETEQMLYDTFGPGSKEDAEAAKAQRHEDWVDRAEPYLESTGREMMDDLAHQIYGSGGAYGGHQKEMFEDWAAGEQTRRDFAYLDYMDKGISLGQAQQQIDLQRNQWMETLRQYNSPEQAQMRSLQLEGLAKQLEDPEFIDYLMAILPGLLQGAGSITAASVGVPKI